MITNDEISSFVEKVAFMREAQKAYKRTRDLGALKNSELAEVEVDRMINIMRKRIDKEAEQANLGLF